MSPTRMARIESALRAALDFTEALNRHDVAGMVRRVSDTCVFESAAPPPDGTVYSGKEAIAQFWQDLFRESPTACAEVEEAFGFGERCVLRWKLYGMYGGEGHLRGVGIFREKDGLICEMFFYVKG